MPIVPLPRNVRNLLGSNTHPGLQLDKYLTPCPQQEQQRDALAKVAAITGDKDLLEELRARRTASLAALGAVAWSRTTASSLALHLARASALENAGIALHPVYGFAYLPCTGLKGLARAFAETVWLPAQPEPKAAAWAVIEEVFGRAPGSDVIGKNEHGRPAEKPWKPKGVAKHEGEEASASGRVVFHDAWPAAWPKLFVDIVNNHHPLYYRGEDAPGDWDSPNPVYLLAVPAGTAFEFAVARRRADVPIALLDRAREWLDGGLTYLGAGAKTAAGYGSFLPAGGKAPATAPPAPALATFAATLRLATPAFLAGAGRQKDDCDLRPATLRGLLRWWWRAMHAGYVDVATLRRLEAAVWGDTDTGGAVRIEVAPLGPVAPVLYDKRAEAQRNGLPRSPDQQTTQGLWYHSYGMHDGGKQRAYLAEGTGWRVVFRVRDGHFVRTDKAGKPVPDSARRIDKAVLLDQARAALWWLCMVGGVGSKSRKGFGNFFLPPELQEFTGGLFVSKGKELRAACGLPDEPFSAAKAGGPALRQMADLKRRVVPGDPGWLELVVPTDNVWRAIDEVGRVAQDFAKKYKRNPKKRALGLPRRIGHGPAGNDRHASPVHYHLHREGNEHVLRVAAFPAARLPRLEESEALLAELLSHFRRELSLIE